MINGLEFNSTNNELNPSDRKDRKIGCIIPTKANDLLYHVDNFHFTIAFFAIMGGPCGSISQHDYIGTIRKSTQVLACELG